MRTLALIIALLFAATLSAAMPTVEAPHPKSIRSVVYEGYLHVSKDLWNWNGHEMPVQLNGGPPNRMELSRLLFQCDEDYAEAVRLDGMLVRVEGVVVSFGRERWVVVGEIGEVNR